MGIEYLVSNFFGIAGATIWNYGTNANITWGPARNEISDKDGAAEVHRAPFLARQCSYSGAAKPNSSIHRLWPVFAALWLQAMVLAFLVVQFQRIETPLSSWLTKIALLLNFRLNG
jgi:hypothetical protein